MVFKRLSRTFDFRPILINNVGYDLPTLIGISHKKILERTMSRTVV